MHTIAIVGADCFIGRQLVASLAKKEAVQLRCLVYGGSGLGEIDHRRVAEIKGDLLDRQSLRGLLVPGCMVVNLAYLWQGTKENNLCALKNLAEISLAAGVKRFIHVSTAIVAGRVKENVISEEMLCRPQNAYERTKLAMEELLIKELDGKCELAILRPSAVFGPEGKNLLKLACGIRSGQRLAGYLKSCLFNKRKMNLVCVENVVAALVYLLEIEKQLAQEVFIISDDEDPLNNYRSLELLLMQELKVKDYFLPRVPLPSFLLSFFLRISGKSNLNPRAVYDCGKILGFGLNKPANLKQGVAEFACWIERNG